VEVFSAPDLDSCASRGTRRGVADDPGARCRLALGMVNVVLPLSLCADPDDPTFLAFIARSPMPLPSNAAPTGN
jgi:hypothetical protein